MEDVIITGNKKTDMKEVRIIVSKFFSLTQEKQERILNAAIKEFASKGFKNASTNEIVKEANISKGLLFHYFNNKKALFLFLYDYFMEILSKDFFDKMDLEESDIFKKLNQILCLKLHLMNQYPEIFNFFLQVNIENSHEIKKDLEDRTNQMIISTYSRLFSNVDTTKFKEGIDTEKTINIILWTFEGIRNRSLEKLRLSPSKKISFDEIFKEVDLYIEILKKSFYK